MFSVISFEEYLSRSMSDIFMKYFIVFGYFVIIRYHNRFFLFGKGIFFFLLLLLFLLPLIYTSFIPDYSLIHSFIRSLSSLSFTLRFGYFFHPFIILSLFILINHFFHFFSSFRRFSCRIFAVSYSFRFVCLFLIW